MKKRIWLQWCLAVALAFLLGDNILSYLRFPVADPNLVLGTQYDRYMRPGIEKSPDVPNVFYTVGADGMRVSRPAVWQERPWRVLLVGCSFTFGTAVGDSDTYAYRFNSSLGDIMVDNGGVGGYGPYHCYLQLRHLLARRSYDMVVYAFINDHLNRGIVPQIRLDGAWSWASRGNSARTCTIIGLPYTEKTDDFRFVDHPLRRLKLPGDTVFPLINFIEQYLFTCSVRQAHVPNEHEKQTIFAEQVGRMALLVQGQGTPFTLMSLDPIMYAELRKVLPHIPWFNNSMNRSFLPEEVVTEDPGRHPAPCIHKIWADRLYGYLYSAPVRARMEAGHAHRQRLRQVEGLDKGNRRRVRSRKYTTGEGY